MDRDAGGQVSALRRLAAGAALVILAAACTDLGPEGAPASIAFDSLPWPAVVVGDTLRGDDGEAAPLTASVFDVGDDPIPDADVRFVALDRGATITGEGYVRGDSVGASVRIVAVVGTLQSVPETLVVTRRPDALHAAGATEIAVEYSAGEVVNSAELLVRVVHATPPQPADTVVASWVVRYEVVGQAPGDTVPGYLIAETGTRRTSADTTNIAGIAAVRFRLNSATLPTLEDTIEVRATSGYRGQPLPGSPVSFLLLIRPRPTS